MESLSFEGLEVNSPEYKRVANRRFYHRHKEEEKARTKKWRENNQDWYSDWCDKNKGKRQAASRRYEYNISEEQFQEKMAAQDGKCAICGKQLTRPVVDHNHSCCSQRKACGQCNRGILCRSCNSFIGLAQESIEILNNAIKYLEAYNGR